MLSVTSISTFTSVFATVTDSIVKMVIAVLDQEMCVRELFYRLVNSNTFYGIVPQTLEIKPVIPPIPTERLPPTLCYISESRKAVIRAEYERNMRAFRPGSSQLPTSQRFLAAPITLSGSDASINVALRPMAAHISLGHQYSSSPAPCPTPVLSARVNSQAEVKATLRGATRVLDALVRGMVDEQWLELPGDVQEPVCAPRMSKSYAQRGQMGAPRMVRSHPRRDGLQGRVNNASHLVESDGLDMALRTPQDSVGATVQEK